MQSRAVETNALPAAKRRILILGGGFAGAFTAIYLEKRLASAPDVEIAWKARRQEGRKAGQSNHSLIGLVRKKFPRHSDPDAIAFRIGLTSYIHRKIDRAHDPIAELFVD